MNARTKEPFRRPARCCTPAWLLGCLLAGCPAAKGPESNAPPSANAGTDQTVSAGAGVTLDGSASSDPDGDAVTFSWRQISGTQVALSNPSAAVTTFVAPDKGTSLAFELTVSDGLSSGRAVVGVSVQPVDSSVQVVEVRQKSVTDDPAVSGDFPNGWTVPVPAGIATRPPDEGETAEFSEQYQAHHVLFLPAIEEELLPGATRTVSMPIAGPSGLAGSVRWIGTSDPLAVTLSLDGTTLATGTAYQSAVNRGGAFLQAQAPAGGLAALSVANTSTLAVKIRMVFASAAQ
jgi:hypothetical protein